MGLVYYLFARHHILPGDYWSRGQGERDLIWALASHEANERQATPRKGPPVTKRKK